MEKANKLSVIVCTKNEARNITDCLKSASFADEILVVDSGSTDDTINIAKKMGVRVIQTDWPGYGPQQNRAIEASNGEWIFSLDADERITNELKMEIIDSINIGTYKVYDVPRKSFFIDRFMRHSGWWPDRTKRLFKKDSGKFTSRENHAHFATRESIGHLKAHLIHYSYRNLEDVITKINRFSSGGARYILQSNKKSSLTSAIGHAIWAFTKTFIIKFGFLDGKSGFVLAVFNAETTYYKYLKATYIKNEKS